MRHPTLVLVEAGGGSDESEGFSLELNPFPLLSVASTNSG
jgi:hypothetical protein